MSKKKNTAVLHIRRGREDSPARPLFMTSPHPHTLNPALSPPKCTHARTDGRRKKERRGGERERTEHTATHTPPPPAADAPVCRQGEWQWQTGGQAPRAAGVRVCACVCPSPFPLTLTFPIREGDEWRGGECKREDMRRGGIDGTKKQGQGGNKGRKDEACPTPHHPPSAAREHTATRQSPHSPCVSVCT